MQSSGRRIRVLFATSVLLTIVFASAAIYEAAVVQPPRAVTSTSTVTVPSFADQASGSYANHLLLFGSKNVTALVGQYKANATIIYWGSVNGLQGNYTGADIRLLYGYWAKHFTYIFIANESQPTIQVATTGSGSSATLAVNSTFDFRGVSTEFGNLNGTVSARTTFVHSGANDASWLISYETWHFLRFWEQYPSPRT